jgi:hypothetical protein
LLKGGGAKLNKNELHYVKTPVRQLPSHINKNRQYE